MHFSNKKNALSNGTREVHLTCTHHSKATDEKFSLLLAIRPRFVGLNRPTSRRHFAYKMGFHIYASGKAGGRCAPRLGTAVLGLAARSRPVAPDAVA